jgi:ribosomal-protein-alanine N-acetyltransferase
MTPSDLQTARLILRKPHPDDASHIFQKYGQDVEVTRYLMWRPHTDLRDAEEAVQRFRDGWERGTHFTWLIIDRETGELAGSIAARKDEHGVNLGYLLVRDFWGRGLMAEAIEAVMQWA